MKEAATAVSKFDDEQKKFEEEKKKAAMAPPSSSPPDFLPLEEDKKIFLNSDGGKCNAVGSYIARVYPKKLGIMFRGGWQTFEANAGGDFGRSFTIPVIETKLSVKGNLKTRFVSIENTVSGCLWKGSF
jgi:hypothetical protein